jgi:hypothetical protein
MFHSAELEEDLSDELKKVAGNGWSLLFRYHLIHARKKLFKKRENPRNDFRSLGRYSNIDLQAWRKRGDYVKMLKC